MHRKDRLLVIYPQTVHCICWSHQRDLVGPLKSQIFLRSSCNPTAEYRTCNDLIDLIKWIHDALDPRLVNLAEQISFPLVIILNRISRINKLTSIINCLTASSVCWLVGLFAKAVLCLAVEGRDGGEVW